MAFPLDGMNERGSPGYNYYLDRIVEGLRSELYEAASRGTDALEKWIENIRVEYVLYEAQKKPALSI